MVVPGAGGQELVFNGNRVSVLYDEKTSGGGCHVVMVAQHCECT